MDHVVVFLTKDFLTFVARVPVKRRDWRKHIGDGAAAAFPVADQQDLVGVAKSH